MLNVTTPGIGPSADLSAPYALAMQRWLEAHPSWTEQKAMDVAVSLFLAMHQLTEPTLRHDVIAQEYVVSFEQNYAEVTG